MSHFLLLSTPIYGHVTPMLAIGSGLVARGHRVTILTGRKYRSAVQARDMTFLPLPAEVDYDDARLDEWLPGRANNGGLAAGRRDIIGIFVRPMVSQYRTLRTALVSTRFDAVVCESAFMGVLPLLVGTSPSERLPVIGVSATPVSVTSVDCAPFGSGLAPGDSAHTRRRNRFLTAVLRHGPLKPIQDAIDGALAELGLPSADGSYFDQLARFDLAFQLAPPCLEYPRRELAPTVRFVGPLRPPVSSGPLPQWWADLDGSRPVVHVTQGTLDNVDPGKLLVPAIRALARANVLVVASTGGRPVDHVIAMLGGSLPGNARVAEFVPYQELFPRTDVVVTNGGFGGVQQALAHGVPLVVAGSTEDKPEVAARVAWSGTGINLRTGRPTPRQLRSAVGTVRRDPCYRSAARRVEREIDHLGDPVSVITRSLEALTSAAGGGNADLVGSAG